MRKVIQIALLPLTESGWGDLIVALCNDGTIWMKDIADPNWELHNSIPQDEEEKELKSD